jgi:hypothetical protein
MTKQPKSLPILLPSKGRIKYLLRALYSLTNFAKASIISIIVILVILLLLTQMEQAFTMLLRMLEFGKISLFVCFMLINLLAISLSHYPIYTYYAGNLNNSRQYVKWTKEYPFKQAWMQWFSVYTFKPITSPQYVKDDYANILRQSLGLSVYATWSIFISYAFLPNMKFAFEHFWLAQIFIILAMIFPFLLYAYIKRKLSPKRSTLAQRKRMYRRIGIYYFTCSILAILFFLIVLFKSNLFSPFGFTLLLITNYMMMLSFVFFRLARPRLRHIRQSLLSSHKVSSVIFMTIIRRLEKSSNYLAMFVISFYASVLAIIYFSLAGMYGWQLPNGIAIVIYLYFYFFIVSALGKYYFVNYSLALKEQEKGEPISVLNVQSFRYLTGVIALFVVLMVCGVFTESRLNELDVVPINKKDDGVDLTSFEARVNAMPDTVFFVTSHGGGLKANAWTLLVLNTLQEKSNGQFMNQTVAMSGASEGSLGLALYGTIYSNENGNTKAIAQTIRKIEDEDFASSDISLMFGLDLIRGLYPLNKLHVSHDRSYYGMMNYQKIVSPTDTKALDVTSYRHFWKQLQKKGKLPLPAMIMNTASTNGKRGIFCSINTNEFHTIFPYAINLCDLRDDDGNDASVPFYQAVSTTNRFPVFSPIAKIKGKGHFTDAGAIDNSGILGCWDLYLYLYGRGVLDEKVVVFVDISNSKSIYAEHLLQMFCEENPKLKYVLDEHEKTSFGANLQTGLNLNKIPGYLNEFLTNYTVNRKHLNYKRIVLPHKISIEDIEAVIDGDILDMKNGIFREKLIDFLTTHNTRINNHLQEKTGVFDKWECYEPVLCRQLSHSNIEFFDRILTSPFSKMQDVYPYLK